MFEALPNFAKRIIPTRCTSHRVHFIWQLLYMFRASLWPIFRSSKQL